MKKGIFAFDDPVFDARVHIVYGHDRAEVEALLDNFGFETHHDDIMDTAEAYTFMNRSKGFDVFIVLYGEKLSLSTIMHECVHLTSYVLFYHNLKHNMETDELFAYYQTFIFKNVVAQLKRLKVRLI